MIGMDNRHLLLRREAQPAQCSPLCPKKQPIWYCSFATLSRKKSPSECPRHLLVGLARVPFAFSSDDEISRAVIQVEAPIRVARYGMETTNHLFIAKLTGFS